ncbi:MAG: diacylglycerol kinase family lipid kinase [Planctomycetes bacterium]|nr:diacylglycerol kinase family lipid kinase [Planctomycetota bacterium]
MPRVLLIVNPVSGRGRGREAAPAIVQHLEQARIRAEIYYTAQAGDARKRASEIRNEYDLVAAVGGDGTLNEVLNGLAAPLPLGLFPLGTANVLALELGIPRTPDAFAHLVARGRTAEIDLFRANGRIGFFSLGAGFDGMVVEQHHRDRRGATSKWAYVPAVVHCLRNYRTPDLRVTLDGERWEGIPQVIIANTRHYGGRLFSLAADRRMDDGLYECYLFRGRGRWAIVRYLARALTRRLLRGDDPALRRAGRIDIESVRPIPYQIDGDFGGWTPVQIEVLPRAARILC